MNQRQTRRRFLRQSIAGTMGYWVVAGNTGHVAARSANDTMRFACIGVGGKGSSDSADAASNGLVVAICDVDDKTLNRAGEKLPQARRYHDFRKLFDEMGHSIDAVVISTPNHTHAAPAALAMKSGKHCFCQKPLGHSVYECRIMADLARRTQVVTQMGNQGVASRGFREAVEVVRSGALGRVREVHVWTNRPIWPGGGSRPAPEESPSHLHWDEFIGPAPYRPYAKGYHPYSWRGYWDFGDGALGDMSSHTMCLPFVALDLRNPTAIDPQIPETNTEMYPRWSVVRYDFPPTAKRQGLSMTWYDGGKKPPAELLAGESTRGSGCLIVGEKGSLYAPSDYGDQYTLLPVAQFAGYEPPKRLLPESPGHFREFVDAIQSGASTFSNFPDLAGPLCELACLGNLAIWAGQRIDWDAKRMAVTNVSGLENRVQIPYRAGYSL